jgi:hypothetical protein
MTFLETPTFARKIAGILTAYTKSEASDLTSDQKKAIRKLTSQLKQIYT